MPVDKTMSVKGDGVMGYVIARVIIVCVLMSAFGGCAHPFFDDETKAAQGVDERLGSIDSIGLKEYSQKDRLTLKEDNDGILIVASSEDVSPSAEVDASEVDMSLEEVRSSALANNLDLKVRMIDPAMARTRTDEERAKFESTFFASLVGTRSDEEYKGEDDTVTEVEFSPGIRSLLPGGGEVEIGGRLLGADADDPDDNMDIAALQFSLTQPLFRGGGEKANRASIQVAQLAGRIARAQTKLEAIRILANADRAYWLLYASRHELEVIRREYDEAARQLEGAKKRVDAGVAPHVEIIRAEAGVAECEEKIISAQRDILIRQRDLKRIVNRNDLRIDSTTYLVPTSTPELVRYDLNRHKLADRAVENRMEMLEMELQLASDAIRLDFQRNRSLPLVTLGFNYSIGGEDPNFGDAINSFSDGNYEEWMVGLQTEIPLGNEQAKARVERAVLRRMRRLATREQQEQSIRQEVLDALDRVEYQWERILAARDSVITSGKRFNAERRQCDVGLRTGTDVLDAAKALSRAQIAEIQALTGYQIAKVDLAFATGTLLGQSNIIWSGKGFKIQ